MSEPHGHPQYREYPLTAPLDRLIECVWFLSSGVLDGLRDSGADDNGAMAGPDVQHIPPDGSVELIVHVRDPFRQIDGGSARCQPQAMVVGVWTRPIAIVAPRTFDTVGIRIRPGCASAFWSEPAALFADTVTDATAVWGREISAIRDRLGETVDDRRRVAILSAFLADRLRRRDPAIARSIDRIVATRGRHAIDAVARDAGIGHRRLERAFRTHVGVSPKMFSRIVRFQQVLRHSRPETAGAWADVAARYGYTDQSHLIRDFQQFTGTTPHELATAEPELADYFRRR
jgi:AraC-like DNA-binding protein